MAASAACECGAEEQTVDDVVLYCTIHRPPYGLHGLTVLDNETIECLRRHPRASEGLFQGTEVDFSKGSQFFSRGHQKWCSFIFPSRNYENNLFC